MWAMILRLLAVAMALFHLYTGVFGVLEGQQQRGVHLAFALLLVLLAPVRPAPAPPGRQHRSRWGLVTESYRWTVLAIALAYGAYFALRYRYLTVERFPYVTDLTPLELFLGIGFVAAVLEGSRRTLGAALGYVALVFIGYAFTGPYLPGILHHSGKTVNVVIDNLAYGTEGIFGEPLAISSTYIILFIIFGAFLGRAGFSEGLIHLARGVAGTLRGGPAKVSVAASALMGMISGSAVANVTTTGTLTIPLMKRTGYRPEFAGAVEAVASTGGQFTPPLLGSAAFLMAQFTGIPYITIARYSILPALLYYVALWLAVDFEAQRLGLRGLARSETAGWQREVWPRLHLGLAIAVLMGLLIAGYTPMYSVVWAIGSLLVAALMRRSTRPNLKHLFNALAEGAELSVSVVMATAVSGIIVGMVALTGIGQRFSLFLIELAGGNLLLALILTMFASLILGMGLPTVPAYLIQVALVIPALVQVGVPAPVAHLFALYFACVSMITPPQAIAAYAAAGIAGGNAWRTGWVAAQIGAPAYLIPFAFAFRPALLLDGAWADVAAAVVVTGLAGYALLLAVYRVPGPRVYGWQRVLRLTAMVLLIAPGWISGAAGTLLLALDRGYEWRRARTAVGAVAAAVPAPTPVTDTGEERNDG